MGLRVPSALAAALLLVWVSACSADLQPAEPGPSFSDEFGSLDASRWTTGEPHRLGQTDMRPANVAVADGSLRITLPNGNREGGEIRTTAALAAGTVRAWIRAADAPSTVTGFFLYSPPDYAHETDIELYNKPAGQARLSTYAGGRLTKTIEVPLYFDPTAAFHEYAIALTETGVEFYADGNVLGSWPDGVPVSPMNLYINAWYPTWLNGEPVADDRVVDVDRITYVRR